MERKKVCRYYEKGSCKKQNCPFVHIRQNRKNCEFYMKGFCKRGNNCNFYHPPKEIIKKIYQKQEIIKRQKIEHLQQQDNEQENDPFHNFQKGHQKKYEGLIKKVEEPEERDKQQEYETEENEGQRIKFDENEFQDQKISQINFLLGINDDTDSQSQKQIEEQQLNLQEDEKLQFTRIYPRKFPDYSKTPQTKQFVKKNEEKYFPKGFLNTLKDLPQQSKQHFQIIRKFQDSFTQLINPLIYRINMRPLLYNPQIMLHFEMLQETLNIQIDQTLYPKQRAKIQIKNQSIPKGYKQKILACLRQYHQKKTLFETLKYLQNNFEQIYGMSKFKLQNQYYSKKQVKNKIQKEKERLNQKTNQQQTNSLEQKKIKNDRKRLKEENAIAMNKQARVIPFKQGEPIEVSQINYQITVQSLMFQNCNYILIARMLLYIQCNCDQKIMHILQASQIRELKVGIKLICKKCSTVIVVCLVREIVQLRATVIGKMGIDNGNLIDIGGIAWKIGCNCDGQITQNKITLPGMKTVTNCHTCFGSMTLMYQGIKYFNPYIKQFQPQNDKQLPNKGACKHKKLSFRWYRYGCCGRIFSCDECHSDGSIRRHQKLNGITMLCGYCSHQQMIGSNCVNCKKQLIKGTDKTGHWEGGYGCRDQTQLSRKDPKKYVGLTKKK